MEKKIEHNAKVVDKWPSGVDVVLDVDEGECDDCVLRKTCEIKTEEYKILSLLSESGREYEVDDRVTVVVEQVVGIKAVMLVYALPALVLFMLVIIFLEFGVSKTASGLTGLGAITIYYLTLYVLRDKLVKESEFRLK